MAVWKAKVEAEFDQWIAVYDQARTSGDPELALKAADRVLDRHFGKPTQQIQHSGGITLDIVLFDDAKDTYKS
jgi:hypothetical protein